jgi:predicted AlkP superfamily phosphohydrolase/phosphomutase
MRRPIVAIALDAADPTDIEAWTDAGLLPNIDAVRRQGMYGRLVNTVPLAGGDSVLSETEMLWVIAQTGCFPYKTGYWGSVAFDPDTYGIAHSQEESGFDFVDHKPFYALGKDYRVCVFDMPVGNLNDDVNGIQVTAWGGHYPFSRSRSMPAELYPDIVQRYGENPILLNDNGHFWDKKYLEWLERTLPQSIATRADIAVEMLGRESWDLFLAGFGETHTAGHDLYHLSHPDSPISPRAMPPLEQSPMVNTFRQIDDAIGRIFAAADPDAIKIVFSAHGITANHSDLGSFFFLPELMYRYSFGTPALTRSHRTGKPPGDLITQPLRKSWTVNVWLQRAGVGPLRRLVRQVSPRRYQRTSDDDALFSPKELGKGTLAWMPNRWYGKSWPRMRAFALPGFAEGHIRVNLAGRERDGIVNAHEYSALLDDISEKVLRIRCARTGAPLVQEVIRAREDPMDRSPNLPDPDLVVVWTDHSTDVVDSPDFGRIGPVPHYRPGGHSERGFFMAAGGDIPAGSTFSAAAAVDVAPTFRSLLGAEIPKHYDGHVITPA